MNFSQKDVNELNKLLTSITKTLKNFDDRLTEVEQTAETAAQTAEDLTDTVTIDLPVAIAETISQATEAAIAEHEADEEEEVMAEDGEEAEDEVVEEVVTQEDVGSIEEFSEMVTITIEGLAGIVNDISERVNKMFIKVFSEEVTTDVSDLTTVKEGMKNGPEMMLTEEDACDCTPVGGQVVAPVAAIAAGENFSKRYKQVKGIFNL